MKPQERLVSVKAFIGLDKNILNGGLSAESKFPYFHDYAAKTYLQQNIQIHFIIWYLTQPSLSHPSNQPAHI
jgi:hypothetical protein